MATIFNPATKISVSGPLSISDKRSADMPLDIRGRIETLTDITTIPFAWEGMLVYVRDTKKYYKVTSLANRTVGGVAIPYYPATWVEFGSGGSTPSPTPSDIDAGDVSYFSSGTFSNNTVGKELQSLASDILSLAENIHNLSGDIGTLSSLNTDYKNDLVGAINEALTSTGSTIAVVNNLLSDSTTDALSAYQGKVLKGLVDGKVAGIKVQGESSVLPMVDGIVTIPASGGGGTGTITGATVGGSPVTESSGILQFEAYPTVPEVPITSIAKKTDDTNPISPSQGRVNLDLTAEDIAYNSSKTVKGKLNDIDKLIKDLTPDPSNNESSSTIIDLSLYSEWEDDESEYHSFVYNSSAIYVYSTSSTSQVKVTSNNTPHAIFKVSDRDIYIDYIVSTSGDDIIYTANAIYDSSTLPSDFKKQFELGVYALIYRIIGRSGDIIPYGKTIIADTDNKVLNVAYRDVVDNNVTKHQLIARAFDKGRIYIYETPDATYTKGYKFKTSYGTADSGFSDLNKLFGGGGDASDIEYDDSTTNLSRPGNPVNNVQQAIQKLAIGISGGFSDVTITLKNNAEQPIANQEVTIAVTYQGAAYDLTTQASYNNGFATDSNGQIALTLPLGAVYQISFHQYTVNYSTPDTLNGIIDKPTCNLTGLYVALSDNEAVLINVNVLNTTSSTTTNDKEAYIDFYVSGSWVHSYTAVLSSIGTPKTIKDAQGNIIKSGNNYVTIDIPKNTEFRIRLQLWDTSLTEEEQIYIASSNVSKIASNARSIINMYYTYALPGLYLIVKDSTTEKGYAEYKILNMDSINNTMEIVINGINYTLSKDASNNIYRKETNSADSPSQWFTQSSSSDILGVGIRSTRLINAAMNDESTYNLGYTNCCFRVSRNFIEFSGQIATVASPNVVTYSNTDGMYQTRRLASFSETQTFPSAQKAINDYKQTLNTSNGSVTIDGFIPVAGQMEIFRTNYTSLMFILPFINGTTLYSPYKNQINYSIGCSNNVDSTTVGSSSDNYRALKGDFTRGSSGLNTGTINFFVFYPF